MFKHLFRGSAFDFIDADGEETTLSLLPPAPPTYSCPSFSLRSQLLGPPAFSFSFFFFPTPSCWQVVNTNADRPSFGDNVPFGPEQVCSCVGGSVWRSRRIAHASSPTNMVWPRG